MGGWLGKILRVNLDSGDFDIEDLDPGFARKYIGAQGTASKILMDEIDPTIDALSPGNKLIFSTSPCTGTGAVCGARAVWVAKSPLTGGIAFSNTGTYFPSELKFAGYDMIVFEGKADLVKTLQDETAGIMDAGGICLFSIAGQSPPTMFEQLETVTGLGIAFQDAVTIGERIWNLQRLFNLRAGITKEQDAIPKRFLKNQQPEDQTREKPWNLRSLK